MQTFWRNSVLFLLTLLIFGCGITYKPNALPNKQLSVGEGGGFTGGVIEWVILENGQIFKRNNFLNVTEERSRIRKKDAVALFSRFESELDSVTYIKPGNLYRFVQLKIDSTQGHRVVWGEGDSQVPEVARSYYESLMKIIQATSPKK